jgi:NMD protein affecting ribosome stability and mRNA decay
MAMKGGRTGFRAGRHEQRFEGLEADAYKPGRKPAGPARCRGCGAVYRRGRWTWQPAGEGVRSALCPACKRARDGMPAGYVRIEGDYQREHRDEVMRRVRRCEAAEKAAHPLQRIIELRPEGEGLLVTTTDSHLARRIGEALAKSYKGSVEYRYAAEDNLLRVTWRR